jgi:hypothetical protein
MVVQSELGCGIPKTSVKVDENETRAYSQR